MFRMICFVYVICLVFVSFWIGYVGLSVFICVGVFSFNRFVHVLQLCMWRVRYGLMCFVIVSFPFCFA